MSRLDDKLYYYAKVTVEAQTPLVLASGKTGNIFDVELVRDANMLPAIPGTTLAGIFRHHLIREDRTAAAILFGSIDKEAERNVSSVEFSWAYAHDSMNVPHKFFLDRETVENDALLSEIAVKENTAFNRDHVCISKKGAVAGSGKFDRSFVPAGTRFTFSIGLWASAQTPAWQRILDVLVDPTFRIGGAGRDGYGKVSVVRLQTPPKGYYDISVLEDLKSFREDSSLVDLKLQEKKGDIIEIRLSYPRGIRVGGGDTSFLDSKHKADLLPFSERVIEWNGDQGSFSEKPVITIPGSSVKGVLRHRSAYHLARIKKQWNCNAEDDGLSELFGDATTESEKSTGLAGKLWFSDLHISETKTYMQSRNSIDRFTGGTIKGALFQEENAIVPTVTVEIAVDPAFDKNSAQFKAFLWAVDDLKNGRLALGGGSGHGLGFSEKVGDEV